MHHFLLRTLQIAGLAVAISPSATALADCPPWWSSGNFPPLPSAFRFYDAVVFDDDGAGPHPPALYVCGSFTNLNGVPGATGVAKWDGVSWSALDGGIYDSATSSQPSPLGQGAVFIIYDADGNGPELPKLILGGDFIHAGVQHPIVANSIASWDGVQWSPLGQGLTPFSQSPTPCETLTLLDEDGAGPNPPSLIVGGCFDHAGASGLPLGRSIALWTGSQWMKIGNIEAPFGMHNYPTVYSAAAFDDDGGGIPTLFVVGSFTGVSGDGAAYSARRSPAGAWSQGIGNFNYLTVIDPDGPGPTALTLFASAGTGLYRYDAGSPAATLIPGSGYQRPLVVFDFDGDGPEPPRLVLSGSTPSVNSPLISTWDGTNWFPLAAGLSDSSNGVASAVSFDDLTDDSPEPRLLVIGTFSGALLPNGSTTLAVPGIAEWGDPLGVIVQEPENQQVAWGAPAQFSIDDGAPANAFTYQWRKEGAVLFNGANISGVNTKTLTIASAHPIDEGSYDVVVTKACGSESSTPATLDVLLPPCAADLNGDGVVGSADLGILLGSWGPNFTQADLSGDHTVNSQDLALLLGSWGPCS